jgi:hypothetical protein
VSDASNNRFYREAPRLPERNPRFSLSEIQRALRAADAPEDSMPTEDDLMRYEGRAEAVAIVRDMLGIGGA